MRNPFHRSLVLAACLLVAACASSESSSTTGDGAVSGSSATSGSGGSGGSGGATTGSANSASSTGGSTSSASTTGMPQILSLTSPDFDAGKEMPSDASCDGAGKSPALAWSGAPADTKEFALLMTTLAKDGLKYNWVLYGIPASTTALASGSSSIGTAGLTSNGPNLAYAPPCSPGPGTKIYSFTLYALSGTPTLPADPKQVTGSVLEQAIASLTLEKASLDGAHTTAQ